MLDKFNHFLNQKNHYGTRMPTDCRACLVSSYVSCDPNPLSKITSPIYRTRSFMEWALPGILLMLNAPANASAWYVTSVTDHHKLRLIFKWHINDIGQAHKMAFYGLGTHHLYAIFTKPFFDHMTTTT